jgi:hypothetical protein
LCTQQKYYKTKYSGLASFEVFTAAQVRIPFFRDVTQHHGAHRSRGFFKMSGSNYPMTQYYTPEAYSPPVGFINMRGGQTKFTMHIVWVL